MVLVSGQTRVWRSYRGPMPIGQLTSPRRYGGIWSDRWAMDNDCYSSAGFDPAAFVSKMRRLSSSPGCLFVACPDVVGDAAATLALFAEWAPVVRSFGLPAALVGQDGLESLDWLAAVLSADAWFVGGTDAWKESAAAWEATRLARSAGKWCHMGRVSTRRRFLLACRDGYDSVDGSGWSKFPSDYMGRADRWASYALQPMLF